MYPLNVGHIALIDKVLQNSDGTYTVEIVEQNWGSVKNSETGRAQLRMMRDLQGHYTIDDRGSFITQGWIRYYPSPSVAPGMYEKRAWNPPVSYAFMEAYESVGGKIIVGEPDVRFNETPFVHDWCIQERCVTIQDFWGGSFGDTAIIFNAWKGQAYLVRAAFWEFYRTNDGPIALGPPVEIEHPFALNFTSFYPCPQSALSCQAFQRGTLFWDGKSVVPQSNPAPALPMRLEVK